MGHYLTGIEIKRLRHLSDVNIELDKEKRQHLLLTGKNGSGKTTLLLAIQKYLKAVNDGNLKHLKEDYPEWLYKAEKALLSVNNTNEPRNAEFTAFLGSCFLHNRCIVKLVLFFLIRVLPWQAR